MTTRWRGALVWVVLGALVVGSLVLIRVGVGRSLETIHLGHDTTRVMGPLNSDGTVDYVAALNAANGAGVTNENNAAVLVRRAAGPEFVLPWMNERLEKEWGFPPLPASAAADAYFVSFYDWMIARAPKGAQRSEVRGKVEELMDRMSALTRRPWREEEDREVSEWLRANDKPLGLFAEASMRERWFLPRIVHDRDDPLFGAMLASLGRMRGMADALEARAMLHLAKGDIAACRADQMVVHRFGRLLMQSTNSLEYSVGMAVVSSAARGDSAMLARGIAAEEARGILAERASLGTLPEAWRCNDLEMRFELLDTITQLKRFGPEGLKRPAGVWEFGLMPAHFDPVLQEANTWYDRVVAAGKLPTLGERQKRYDEIVRDRTAELATLAGRTSTSVVLRRLAIELVPDKPGRISLQRDQARMRLDLVQVGLALAICKAQGGKYPDKLDELVPGFLQELPRDSFSDEALMYRRVGEGYLLYSVGPNLRDDGGVRDEPAPMKSMNLFAARPVIEHDDLTLVVEK